MDGRRHAHMERNEMILSVLPFIRKNCYSEDMVQDVVLETIKFIDERYDETKGKLITYVGHIIKYYGRKKGKIVFEQLRFEVIDDEVFDDLTIDLTGYTVKEKVFIILLWHGWPISRIPGGYRLFWQLKGNYD